MKYVILAGGSGSRLWPLSRKNFAKQFLNLTNEHSLLQNTGMRVSEKNGEDVFVISNKESKFIIHEQMKKVFSKFKENNLIVEPEGRNTAPAIAYGSLFFDKKDIIVILSADHHIVDKKKFNRALENARKIAEKDYIVTLGVLPDSPNTGYGYIKKSDKKIDSGFVVENFVEKPDLLTAKKYVASKNYFWNAGIFIFKVSVFLEELQKYSKNIYDVTKRIGMKLEQKKEDLAKDYKEFPKISIDYALMEKTKKLVVVPASFGWNDIGSFKTLYENLKPDKEGNVFKGKKENFLNVKSKNLLVFSSERKVATIGLESLAIIDTPDALLVANIEKTEEVKTVFNSLQKQKAIECEDHKQIYKPWGSLLLLQKEKKYSISRLCIDPGKQTDWHCHKKCSETWTVVKGKAEVVVENEKKRLSPPESICILPKEKHKLINLSTSSVLEVIVIQSGDLLGKDDIIKNQ